MRRALRTDPASMVSAIWRDDAPVTGELLRPVMQEDTVLYKLRQTRAQDAGAGRHKDPRAGRSAPTSS